ncbi:hypothetical protein SVIOM74S_10566 [Streptomyces violarus]
MRPVRPPRPHGLPHPGRPHLPHLRRAGPGRGRARRRGGPGRRRPRHRQGRLRLPAHHGRRDGPGPAPAPSAPTIRASASASSRTTARPCSNACAPANLDLCLTSPVPDAPDLVARRLDEQKLRLVVPADHSPRGPPPHPPRRGRRRNVRHPGTRLRPPPHHRRPLPGGRLQAPRRLRGRGGGNPAGPGGSGLWSGPPAPAGRPASGGGGTDGYGPPSGPRNRRRLAGRPPGHAPGSSLQEVPALQKGQLVANLGARGTARQATADPHRPMDNHPRGATASKD